MIKYVYSWDKDKWEEYTKIYFCGILIYKSTVKWPCRL